MQKKINTNALGPLQSHVSSLVLDVVSAQIQPSCLLKKEVSENPNVLLEEKKVKPYIMCLDELYYYHNGSIKDIMVEAPPEMNLMVMDPPPLKLEARKIWVIDPPPFKLNEILGGFPMVFASSDVSSLKESSEEEIASTIGSCNVKIFLKVEDISEEYKIKE